jgi:hypothetical protein
MLQAQAHQMAPLQQLQLQPLKIEQVMIQMVAL